VILLEARAADGRVIRHHEILVESVVGAAARDFVPAVGHLIPQTHAHVKFEKSLISSWIYQAASSDRYPSPTGFRFREKFCGTSWSSVSIVA